MFHQSVSRNQRAKSSKAKRTVQMTVLLAVVVWLLYQSKHSYDRKTEVAETSYNKLGKGDTDINFGRKVNAGSHDENSIDVHIDGYDETTETKENGVDGDESQQGITNNGNVDDNGEVNTEGALEGAHEGENGEIGGGNRDKAEPLNQELSDTSVFDDQSNTDVSEGKDTTHEGETVESQVDTPSDTVNTSSITEEEDATNARSDAEVVDENASFPNSNDENNVASEDFQKEVDYQMGNNSMDATSAETGSNDGNSNLLMQDGIGSPESEEGESQVDINIESESEATGNNSIKAVTDDKNSKVENGNLPSSDEENSSNVLSDNNGAPKDEEFQSQKDSSSEDAKTEAISDNEQSNLDVSQEVATDDNVIKENATKSSDAAAVEEIQSQENNDQDIIEEKSDEVVSSSAQNDEQNDSEMHNKVETPNEEGASHGDGIIG